MQQYSRQPSRRVIASANNNQGCGSTSAAHAPVRSCGSPTWIMVHNDKRDDRKAQHMTTKLKTRQTAKVAAIDPILAAIAEHRALAKEITRLDLELEVAENEAAKTFRRRPSQFIEWRNHKAIGGSEIESARDFFYNGLTNPQRLKSK
jgi:hypothetical protein